MKAIISDIHGNLEALQAAFDDIDSCNVSEVLCLGDVVGYGPDPLECLDIVMQRCKWMLCGNHEWALLNRPVGFSPPARKSIELTKELFEAETDAELGKKRWDYLSCLEPNKEEGDVLYVHGSPIDPIMDYIFPEQYSHFWDHGRVDDLLRTVPWLCFCGHSHVPFVITSMYDSIVPLLDEETYDLDKEKKYIVNVGAVGQPRDRNNKACYVLYDEDAAKVTFRRVPYDHAATAAKIRERGFHEKLATRLQDGT